MVDKRTGKKKKRNKVSIKSLGMVEQPDLIIVPNKSKTPTKQ